MASRADAVDCAKQEKVQELVTAAAQGDTERLQQLLSTGLDPNRQSDTLILPGAECQQKAEEPPACY